MATFNVGSQFRGHWTSPSSSRARRTPLAARQAHSVALSTIVSAVTGPFMSRARMAYRIGLQV